MDKKDLRCLNFNPNQSYNLEDLNFYLPKKNITPFLLIEDSKGNKDILKLTQHSVDKSYFIYSVSLENSTILYSGNCSVSIVILDNDILKSTSLSLYLNVENFKIARQIYLIEGINKEVLNAYKKIEEMTKMNIEIYTSIEEVMSND